MDDRIDKAISTIQRSGFIKRESDDEVPVEQPITMEDGQSQANPSILRGMLTWLAVKPGQKVLSVGTGTGWITSLLAMLVGEKGTVVGVEASSELLAQAEQNVADQHLKNVSLHHAAEDTGWQHDAPYDRILISSSTEDVPPVLLDQLAPDGKLVAPIIDEIVEVTKGEGDDYYRTPHGDFMFVPIMNCAD